MAKGLRIHHPTERDVILLIPIPAKRPDLGGIPKDIRIHLDENGDSLISEGVWEELMLAKRVGLSAHEFVVLNEVSDPPTLLAGPGLSKLVPKRTLVEKKPGLNLDTDLQAVAQQFAPKGLKAQITTRGKENGQ